MSFLHPYVLLGLAVPLLLAGALLMLHRRTGSAWRLLVSAEHPELVHRRPQWQLVLPPVLALLALAGLICAAARPINGYTQSEASSSGRNLLIALDISRSMETKDVKPSRLEEARAAAYELIEALPGDKIGLIVFSGEADVVVPLTYDHTALRDALEQVNRDWAGYGGTNFGLLLRTAMQSFARSAPEGANALIILSDGEDTVGSSSSIAEEARKKHLLVITVGIGTTTGDTIPDPDGENGLWQNAAGSHVVSKLDVQSLRQFSEATGGDFILMNSGTDLAAFARDAADKLERHEESYAAGSTPQDLFVWFAVPSLLALLAAILLSTEWRRPRRKATALLLLLLVLTPAAQAAEASAAQAYARALEARQAGRDSEHLEQLSQALLSQDSELQAAAHLALGNRAARATFDKLRSLYGESSPAADSVAPAEAAATPPGIDALQGIVDELRKDLTYYRDALAANPSLSAAQTNIHKIEQLIRVLEDEIERMKQEQQQQQQQQQQQDKQDDKDSSKDQDNKDKQDDKDSSKDQDNKDKQDDKNSSKDQDNKDKQDDKDSSKGQDNKDKKDDKDSSKDQDNKDKKDGKDSSKDQGNKDKQDDKGSSKDQDNKDKQDDKDSSKGQDNKDKQDASSQGAAPQQPQDSADESSQNQPADARQQEADEAVEVGDPVSDDEKERRRAEGILRMHLDEEKGSPIPHFNRAVRPPSKDY